MGAGVQGNPTEKLSNIGCITLAKFLKFSDSSDFAGSTVDCELEFANLGTAAQPVLSYIIGVGFSFRREVATMSAVACLLALIAEYRFGYVLGPEVTTEFGGPMDNVFMVEQIAKAAEPWIYLAGLVLLVLFIALIVLPTTRSIVKAVRQSRNRPLRDAGSVMSQEGEAFTLTPDDSPENPPTEKTE